MTSTLVAEANLIDDVDSSTHGVLAVLDRTGDTKIIWDRSNADEVAAAKKTFDDLIAKRFVAYSVDDKGNKGAQIRTFDATAGKIILAPALVGG